MSLTDLSIHSEKGFEEAVRNYELVKRREQKEEDKVTLEEIEKERVEALELVEKEREIVEQEKDVYDKIADKLSKRHTSHNILVHLFTHTEKLKSDLHDAMYTFDEKFTATVTDLKTKRFTNLGRQEQLSEKIWHLENSMIEQRVEETEVRECLRETRSELKELKDRRRTLSSLIDHEQHWIETIGIVSE